MQEYFDHREVKTFFKLAAIAVGLLGLFLLVKTAGVIKDWRTSAQAYNTISVSGEGEAYSVPDVATFSFSVSADAKAVGDAQDIVTKKTNAIVAALKGLGVEDKDIKTTDYSVYPKYTYQSAVCPTSTPSGSTIYCPPGRQVADGYTVTNTLTVKIHKTDNAGQALGVAGQNGATNISSLSFTVDDPTAVEAEARGKAIEDARTKAQTLAKSLGVSLSRVVSFTESSGGYPQPIYNMVQSAGGIAPKASIPSIQTGQNKVVSNVSVTYEIR